MFSWLTPTVIVGILCGGLAGALVKEVFERRKGRTISLPLVEMVNQNPLLYELKGIKLVRVDARGKPADIGNIRHYQFRLLNTSGRHIRNLDIQFKFRSAESIEPWITAAAVSKTEPVAVEPSAISQPWLHTFRWRIPQLAVKDFVDIGFQSINPSSIEYEAFADSEQNVVLRATKADVDDPRRRNLGAVMVVLVILVTLIGSAILTDSPSSRQRLSSLFGRHGAEVLAICSTSGTVVVRKEVGSDGPHHIGITPSAVDINDRTIHLARVMGMFDMKELMTTINIRSAFKDMADRQWVLTGVTLSWDPGNGERRERDVICEH